MTDKTYDARPDVEIPLDFPVTVDGEQYTRLKIRRPKTKDGLLAARRQGSEAERSIFLFAMLCNVAPAVIEELDEVDAAKLTKQYEAFKSR